MNNGYMWLHRQLLDWEWFENSHMVHLWVYFLLKANYQDKKWRGIDIPRGSFVTSLDTISKDTKLSIQSIRTCIEKLKSTGEITVESTHRYSIVTICKYDNYNDKNNDTNTVLTQSQHTPNIVPTESQQSPNTVLTITNKDNKDNKENKDKKDIISTEGVVAEANDGQNAMINALIEQNELLKRQIEELTKKPKRKKKDPDPAFSEAKNIFTSKYKSLFGQDYYWQAKDAGCMTKLLSQIRFSRKSKGLSDDTEGVLDGLRKFLDYIKDDFILNHFDVSMLVNQYNSIMTGQKAKRGELTGQVLRRERGEYNEKNFFEI